MSFDYFVLHYIENPMWHQVESWAERHPRLASFSAVPIALETFARASLSSPFCALESTIRLFHSMKDRFKANSPEMRQAKFGEMKRHSIEVIQNILYTPVGVLVGIGGAIASGVKVFRDPLKTAKIKASECDLQFFSTTNSLKGKAVHIAYLALGRFKDEVQAATNRQALINKHFLDSPALRKQFLDEIHQLLNEIQQVENENQPLADRIAKTPSALVKVLLSCQATSAFYQQAQQALKDFNGRDLAIRKVLHEQAEFGACCDYDIGEIWISNKLDARAALCSLIFELANMIHASRFHALRLQAIKKQIDKTAFASAMEEIEYDSALLHTTTIKDAIAEQGEVWRDIDCLHQSALDEDAHFDHQKKGGHTAYYEKMYENNVQ